MCTSGDRTHVLGNSLSEQKMPDKRMLRDFDQGLENSRNFLQQLDKSSFLGELAMPLKVHSELFSGIGDFDQEKVGVLRDQDIHIKFFTEGLTIRKSKLAKPDKIALEMERYSKLLIYLSDNKEESVRATMLFAFAIYHFFKAHPFKDGNGRILRLIIQEFCHRFGYFLSEKWTVVDRPYGRHLSYGIRSFKQNPHILFGALAEYFLDFSPDSANINAGSSGGNVTLDVVAPIPMPGGLFPPNPPADDGGSGNQGGGNGYEYDEDSQEFFDHLYDIIDETP